MMTNLNVGDKVIILNVEGIMFGTDAWEDNEITTVVEVHKDAMRLSTNKLQGALRIQGVPSFLVTSDEYMYLARLVPVVVEERAPFEFKRGVRVRVKDHPYFLRKEHVTGTIVGKSTEYQRGEYEVKLDGYMRLSFNEDEMEAL